MRRIRFVAALAAVLALTISASALAASPFTKITGGTTTLSLSSAATTALQNAHLTATPIAPATANGSTFTTPIAGGRVNLTNLRGYVTLKGGFTVSNGKQTGAVRGLTIISTGKSAALYGVVRSVTKTRCHVVGRRHPRIQCRTLVRRHVVKLAKITGVTRGSSSVTGQAQLTAASAKLLDGLSGGTTFKAGQAVGTITVTPTFGTPTA
jgi:hypothetical protein